MSTNSTIAVKTKTGYNVIYCHWDGHPSYMLPMLQKNYNSEELADTLISFGDASCIRKKLKPVGPHSFDKPEKDVCVFYHRDNEEPWKECSPILFNDKDSLLNINGYLYIFEDNCWTVYKDGRKVGN
jgi:hypothetical protein